jgi:hypothetical protein
MGVEMRREEAVAARRVQPASTVESHGYPRRNPENWRQLAYEVRRLDVAIERILLVLDADLGAFVRARNAAKW